MNSDFRHETASSYHDESSSRKKKFSTPIADEEVEHYEKFFNSTQQGVFIRKKDFYFNKRSVEQDLFQRKVRHIGNSMKNDKTHYLERYSDQIIKDLQKQSQIGNMDCMKVKPSKRTQVKSKILKDYLETNKK